MEWKFGLAVLEEEYERRHAIVIPYNLLTYPIAQIYLSKNKDSRKQVFTFLCVCVCVCVSVKEIELVLRIYDDENENDNKKQYCNDDRPSQKSIAT